MSWCLIRDVCAPHRLLFAQESEASAAAASQLAEGVTFSHPSLPAWLRSKQVAANILTEQHAFLQHLADAGKMQSSMCVLIMHSCCSRHQRLQCRHTYAMLVECQLLVQHLHCSLVPTLLTVTYSLRLRCLCVAGLVQQRECMELENLMHDRFKLLLQSNTGLTAALSYSRSRPPLNLIPLFDSLEDSEADALMRGGSSKISWGTKVSRVLANALFKLTKHAGAQVLLPLCQAYCVEQTAVVRWQPMVSLSSSGTATHAFAAWVHCVTRGHVFYLVFCLQEVQDGSPANSKKCYWKVFYPEQLIASAGSPITDVIVITKGAVRMSFPPTRDGKPAVVKEHTVVASVGELTTLFVAHRMATGAQQVLHPLPGAK